MDNQWIVPPGRYKATLTQVKKHDDDCIRLVFKLEDGKKAGKHYYTQKSYWLEKDLCSWLGLDRLQELAVNGTLSPEELKKLIGKEAVLVITNENLGKEVPLVVIREILPHTSQNLRWVNANEPKFRMSFAPNAEDIAIAA
jgi:hypothetical protein